MSINNDKYSFLLILTINGKEYICIFDKGCVIFFIFFYNNMNSKNINNDSSSEDDAKVYETLTKLYPANELMPRKLTIDIDVKSLYPLK